MSKIQCGGFNFDDSSFEMKTVNGQKVLGNKYGGVVAFPMSEIDGKLKADVNYKELADVLRNGNIVVFKKLDEKNNEKFADNNFIYFLIVYVLEETQEEKMIAVLDATSLSYITLLYVDGYFLEQNT